MIPLRNGQVARHVERERQCGIWISLGQLPGPDGSRLEGKQPAEAELTHESEAAGLTRARTAWFRSRLAWLVCLRHCRVFTCLSHSARRSGKAKQRTPSRFSVSVSLAR
jgi:hypothetical protein